jgi:hypothetical protein
MSGRDVLWVVVAVLGVLLLIPVLGMAFWGWGWMMGPGMMGPGMMTRWGGVVGGEVSWVCWCSYSSWRGWRS